SQPGAQLDGCWLRFAGRRRRVADGGIAKPFQIADPGNVALGWSVATHVRSALALGAVVLLASACSGTSSPSARTPEGTQPSVESPTSVPTSLPTATNGWREGLPIDSTVSTFSLPALRDDRHLNVAGGFGTEIILNAEKDVPYLPGEPVGQGAKAYDQLFLAWNPATGSFRDLWTNQDPRREDILDVDSGWVLTLLYRLNPCTSWTLRIRNLSTGEVRDVDPESDASRGLECAVAPQLDGGDVVYVRLSGSG